MQINIRSALLGAGLVAIGYFMGTLDIGSEARAQGHVDSGLILGDDHPAIVTSSADGKTLYIWSLGAGRVANPLAKPQIIDTVRGM